MKLNENIAALRKKKGLTQEELARVFGVTNQAVSKWESAQSCPDVALLPEIAAFFGVSVDGLMGMEPSLARIVSAVEDYVAPKVGIMRLTQRCGRRPWRHFPHGSVAGRQSMKPRKTFRKRLRPGMGMLAGLTDPTEAAFSIPRECLFLLIRRKLRRDAIMTMR